MTKKTCFACGAEKDLNDFYKHPQMADGHLGKCKECHKKSIRENRAEKIEYYQEFDRTRYHKDPERKQYTRDNFKKWLAQNPDGRTISTREWRKRNPEKYKAHSAVASALRKGILKRQGCKVCGEKAQAHHEDYSKPLEVIWLCPVHHSGHHVETRDYTQWTTYRKSQE